MRRLKAEVIRTFRFEAAHLLPAAPEGHKCRHIHGHSYRVDVHVTGELDPQSGWVIDFGKIKRLVEPIIEALDHHCLNDIQGLENPTSELLAKYLWDRIAPVLEGVSAVTVWESETSRCTYRG